MAPKTEDERWEEAYAYGVIRGLSPQSQAAVEFADSVAGDGGVWNLAEAFAVWAKI